jgi:hypothetical protein
MVANPSMERSGESSGDASAVGRASNVEPEDVLAIA